MTDQYVLRGGQSGAERLKLLNQVKWPTTRSFLKRVGLRRGMRCLDAGCGAGALTLRLARWVGRTGQAVGIDLDGAAVELARQRAAQRRLPAQFHQLRAQDCAEAGAYDLVFARFLLSHLPDPGVALSKLGEAVQPGGVVALEDTDFGGHFCYPASAAFERYVTWYREAVRRKGGDAEIGPKLASLMTAAGLEVLGLEVVLPTYQRGPGKHLGLVTLEHIRESLLTLQLTTPAELDQTVRELSDFVADERTIVSLPRIFQVWGRKR